MSDNVKIAITLSDGAVARSTILLLGRFPAQPSVPGWRESHIPGLWMRVDSDANIQAEVDKIARALAVPRKDRNGDTIPGVSVVSWRRISAEEGAAFETNRTYRDALRDTPEGIKHDMSVAREIHRNLLRRQRASVLAELDIAWMRSAEQGVPPKDIAEEKQRLRDITAHPGIDAATTVEELRAVTLNE